MTKPTGRPDSSNNKASDVKVVKTDKLRPKGYEGSCLRPLGLCDLGGCCDICWYSSTRKSSEKS